MGPRTTQMHSLQPYLLFSTPLRLSRVCVGMVRTRPAQPISLMRGAGLLQFPILHPIRPTATAAQWLVSTGIHSWHSLRAEVHILLWGRFPARVDFIGVSCYSSEDLATWQSHGANLQTLPYLCPRFIMLHLCQTLLTSCMRWLSRSCNLSFPDPEATVLWSLRHRPCPPTLTRYRKRPSSQ